MALSDYRFDHLGRPIHKDLDALAVRITKALDANKGKIDEFPLPIEEYAKLMDEQAYFNGGSPVCIPHDKVNFVWRGVAVVPADA